MASLDKDTKIVQGSSSDLNIKPHSEIERVGRPIDKFGESIASPAKIQDLQSPKKESPLKTFIDKLVDIKNDMKHMFDRPLLPSGDIDKAQEWTDIS